MDDEDKTLYLIEVRNGDFKRQKQDPRGRCHIPLYQHTLPRDIDVKTVTLRQLYENAIPYLFDSKELMDLIDENSHLKVVLDLKYSDYFLHSDTKDFTIEDLIKRRDFLPAKRKQIIYLFLGLGPGMLSRGDEDRVTKEQPAAKENKSTKVKREGSAGKKKDDDDDDGDEGGSKKAKVYDLTKK